MKELLSIILLVTALGPSVRIYGKENQIRFMYDGLLIELVDRVLSLIKEWNDEP